MPKQILLVPYLPLVQMNGFLVLEMRTHGQLPNSRVKNVCRFPERNRSEAGRHLHRKLAQLVTDHVLSNLHLVVDLAIVYGKLESHEAGQDGGGSRLGLDGLDPFAGLGADDRETGGEELRQCMFPRNKGTRRSAADMGWGFFGGDGQALRDDMRSWMRVRCQWSMAGRAQLPGNCGKRGEDSPFQTERPLRRAPVGLILSDFWCGDSLWRRRKFESCAARSVDAMDNQLA
jgi:hypothetical protein